MLQQQGIGGKVLEMIEIEFEVEGGHTAGR